MTGVDRERLGRLLGGDETAWLVARLRRRLERGRPLRGTVSRQQASDAERHAVARLLGRPLRAGGSVSVPLDALERVLARAGAAPDLRTAVEALTGPVADVAGAAVGREAAWSRVLADAEGWATERGLDGWVEQLRATGLVRRLAGGDPAAGAALLEQARRVVAALPGGGVPRQRLAATMLGDSHALDDDRPLATLVVRAAAHLGGVEATVDQGDAAWRRQVWAGVGVLVGELSAPVLTLGLTASASSPTGRMLATAHEAGEALCLTLRQLVREAPDWTVEAVWVCENPTVVAAAADELGARCAPLVCSGGQPSTAVTTLLRQVAASGATLRYHGDFDWPGLAIATGMIERLGALPWRMRTDDYLAASARSTRPLDGAPVEAAWDLHLAPAMAERGVRVEEELVLDDLLDDLDRAPAQDRPGP